MTEDIALFNILTNNLLAVVGEMSAGMFRSAYSTVIRETADVPTFLVDAKGRVLAQSQNIPLHMSSVSPALTGALNKVNTPASTEDDVTVLSDLHNGGQYQSDVYMFPPIVREDKLVAFLGNVGHHADPGRPAGFNLCVRDTFEERSRFTPMRFSFSRDRDGGILRQILQANPQLLKNAIGDFDAQLVASETGRRGIHGSVDQHGHDEFMEVSGQLLDYVERTTRVVVEQIPDGDYYGECMTDDDGIHDDPVTIKVEVTVQRNFTMVNYRGTSDQVVTATSCPIASTMSVTYSALKMILTDSAVPIDDRAYRSVHVTVPESYILNPREYTPAKGRNIIIMRVFQSILKAFEDVFPERVPARGYDQRTKINLQWQGDTFVATSGELGGDYGIGTYNDGADLANDPLGNCKNLPAESLEVAQRFFRILRYGLRPDSGGAGKIKEGLGVIREYESPKDHADMTFHSDHFRYPARGAKGGRDGVATHLKVQCADGLIKCMRAKGYAVLKVGDRVEMALGGKADYENSLEQDRKKLEQGIACRRITREEAQELYGYEG